MHEKPSLNYKDYDKDRPIGVPGLERRSYNGLGDRHRLRVLASGVLRNCMGNLVDSVREQKGSTEEDLPESQPSHELVS